MELEIKLSLFVSPETFHPLIKTRLNHRSRFFSLYHNNYRHCSRNTETIFVFFLFYIVSVAHSKDYTRIPG